MTGERFFQEAVGKATLKKRSGAADLRTGEVGILPINSSKRDPFRKQGESQSRR
jgi:hypothetical protein